MDWEVIEQKLESLQRMETKRPTDAATLVADIDLQDIVALNLSRAVQICVDIGAHLIAEWMCRLLTPWDKLLIY